MRLAVPVALIATILVLVVGGGTRPPGSVQPIAWNRESCAHCRMLIGDPAYAAQIITEDGDVLSFDDPGCAARYLRERRPRVHRAWFHAGPRADGSRSRTCPSCEHDRFALTVCRISKMPDYNCTPSGSTTRSGKPPRNERSTGARP